MLLHSFNASLMLLIPKICFQDKIKLTSNSSNSLIVYIVKAITNSVVFTDKKKHLGNTLAGDESESKLFFYVCFFLFLNECFTEMMPNDSDECRDKYLGITAQKHQ